MIFMDDWIWSIHHPNSYQSNQPHWRVIDLYPLLFLKSANVFKSLEWRDNFHQEVEWMVFSSNNLMKNYFSDSLQIFIIRCSELIQMHTTKWKQDYVLNELN